MAASRCRVNGATGLSAQQQSLARTLLVEFVNGKGIAADTRLRSLPYWESLEPIPAPAEQNVAAGREDPRIHTSNAAEHAMHDMYPACLHRHPPRLGEHNTEVLLELGYSAAEIEALRTSAVIGQER